MTLAVRADARPALHVLEPPCCASHRDDARSLAQAVATTASPGLALDIGCGSGEVGLAVARARPDVTVFGVDISDDRVRLAGRRADTVGLNGRFQAVTGSAFEVELPKAANVFANPPLLPGEPGFSTLSMQGTQELFWPRLVRMACAWPIPVRIWLHVFDFVAAGGGPFPSVREVASELGLEMAVLHQGWRSIGPGSALRAALPRLREAFPDATARLGASAVRFADLPTWMTLPLSTPHSIVLLASRSPMAIESATEA